jgi:Putative beta barrel porin-7 (BBP7)
VHQQVRIDGGSVRNTAGEPTEVFPNQSILYVQRTNAGRYSHDRFGLLSEVLVRLGYQITSHVRATVGYDLLALTSVVRPGAAIDEGVNPSNTRFIVVRQPSTELRPVFLFRGTDFWAQGLTAGLAVAY